MIDCGDDAQQVKLREQQVARMAGGQAVPELPDGVGRGTEGVVRIKSSAEPAVQRDDVKQNKRQHDHGGNPLQPLAQIAAVMMFRDAEFQLFPAHVRKPKATWMVRAEKSIRPPAPAAAGRGRGCD